MTILRDRDLFRLLECAHEQPVGLLGAVLRQQVVALAEVDRVDLVQVDEVQDVDRLGQLDVEAVEVLLLERHEAALLDLEAAHDVVVVHVLAGVAPDLVVADRLQVALVEEVEAELLRLGRPDHPYRDADEAERERSRPERAGHDRTLPGSRGLHPRRAGNTLHNLGSYVLQSFSTYRGVTVGAGYKPASTCVRSGDKPVEDVEKGRIGHGF